jgi:lipoprotein-anchoring transpeptidase ErfK/SrfK
MCTVKSRGAADGRQQRGNFMSQVANLVRLAAATAVAGWISSATVALADPLSLFEPERSLGSIFDRFIHGDSAVRAPGGDPTELGVLPAHLRRQMVEYQTREAPGTIIIDTANTYLYLILSNGRAIRYGIGVGRDGFTWSGVETVARKAEWPDWYPPAEMLQRQPYLPRVMAGGPGNPLGARALYLGSTTYRIHGTNQPATIGHRVSSGCIRMTNEDVVDLYGRVSVGAKVVVLSMAPRVAANPARTARPAAALASNTRSPLY